jgi:hypothetical protein
MTIWDEFKAAWQLAGVALPERSKVNVVDRQTNSLAGNLLIIDGPGRVDFTPPETNPLYQFNAVAAPFSATGDDLWLVPGGVISNILEVSTPINRRQILSDIGFRIISTPLATDSVQIDVTKNGSLTGLTLTVPPNTGTGTFLLSNTVPVTFEVGDSLGLRLRQSGTALQAAWNAYIIVC